MDSKRQRLKSIFIGGFLVFSIIFISAKKIGAESAGPYSMGFNLNLPVGVGDTSNVLKDGFGFGLDFGYRPEECPLGLRFDMTYANFGLTSAVLNQINRADAGYATIWGLDMSLLLTPPHAKTVRPYLQFGPGFYYEHAEASRFTGSGGVVCDPWFGCYNVTSAQSVQDWSTWRLGWMGGAGLNIEFSGGGALYFQSQYHLINNSRADTEFVPIAAGFRQSF